MADELKELRETERLLTRCNELADQLAEKLESLPLGKDDFEHLLENLAAIESAANDAAEETDRLPAASRDAFEHLLEGLDNVQEAASAAADETDRLLRTRLSP